MFELEEALVEKEFQVTQVLRACKGMPMVLKLVGKLWKRRNRNLAWKHTLKSLESAYDLMGTKDMSSYLGWMYK